MATLLKYQDLLEPLENIISLGLITGITKRKCNQLDTNIQRSYLPRRGRCIANPRREYASSVKVTTHLVKHLKHLKHTSYQTSLLVVGTQSNQLRKTRKTQKHQVRCLTWQLKKGHRCGWQYFLSEKWAPIWLKRSYVMLSNHNMTGQSMIFPPRINECMRTSLYGRQHHDL